MKRPNPFNSEGVEAEGSSLNLKRPSFFGRERVEAEGSPQKRPSLFGRERVEKGSPWNLPEGVKEKRSSWKLPSSQGNGYQVPRPIPETHPLPHNAEAEAFLQDMSDSFRPHKIPKVEPVDVPLPPVAPRSVKTVRFPLPPPLSPEL